MDADAEAGRAATPPSLSIAPGIRGFLAVVREDLQTHGRDPRSPGFQALIAHRLATALADRSSQTLRWLGPLPCRLLRRRAVTVFGVYLDPTAQIGRRVYIPHQGGVVVHAGAVVGDECWLRQRIVVGGERRGATVLGRDVQLGSGAVVLPGVVVGDNVRVGPNAVVSQGVAPGAAVMPPRNTTTIPEASNTNEPLGSSRPSGSHSTVGLASERRFGRGQGDTDAG